MANNLLSSVIGGLAKKPFVRRTWFDTNKTKRGKRIQALNSQAYYKPIDANLFATSQPIAAINTGNGYFALKQDNRSVGAVSTTTIALANILVFSTDCLKWEARSLPGGLICTSLIYFESKIWVFSKTTVYKSTDNTGTSWSAGPNSPHSTGVYKPIVFNGRVVVCQHDAGPNVYSLNPGGAAWSTHAVTGTSIVFTGFATDGTTLYAVGYSSTGIGYIFKTTDLTTWTAVPARLTEDGFDLTNTATNAMTNAGFIPVGITYNGTKFCIAAQDATLGGGGANSIVTGGFRFYTASPGDSHFLLKGDCRIDNSDNINVYNKIQFVSLVDNIKRSTHLMDCDSTGRIAMMVCYGITSYVQTAIYYTVSLGIIYSDDDGVTWSISDYSPRELGGPFGTQAYYIPSGFISTPFGFLGFAGCNTTNTVDFYIRTDENASELVMPY